MKIAQYTAMEMRLSRIGGKLVALAITLDNDDVAMDVAIKIAMRMPKRRESSFMNLISMLRTSQVPFSVAHHDVGLGRERITCLGW